MADQIDNLYWFMKATPLKAVSSLRKVFNYNPKSKLYTHKKGAEVTLYDRFPQLPIDLSNLTNKEAREFQRRYNIGGVISTPRNDPYGITIPALLELAVYCEKNNIPSAFTSVRRPGYFALCDAEKGLKLDRKDLERRIKPGHRKVERREEILVSLN